MSDWSSGYVSDIGYTYGYYPELNPLRLKLAFLNAGLEPPEVGTACELGFGQGLSVNIHAAASVVQWCGTDFNPSQAGFAQQLAEESGVEARLFDEAFNEFCAREDLPDFDFIGLHGIWSWISDENRRVLVDFIKRKLKVGGVLYISYNTLPGWSVFAPIRHLMTEHAEVMSAPGRGIVAKIDNAIEFVDKWIGTNPIYTRLVPNTTDRFKLLKQQDRSYLAHEYFNRDWQPMYFDTMAGWLAPAKLDYACSAHLLSHVDVLNFTVEQQALIAQVPDKIFRETVRDFLINQQFRKDYWVKGARRLAPAKQLERIRGLTVILTVPSADVKLKIRVPVGDVGLSEEVYKPLLDKLSDHKPKSLGQLETLLKNQKINLTQIIQAMLILNGVGMVSPTQDEEFIKKAKKHSDRLNTVLVEKARSAGDIATLCSPVLGGGFNVGRFQQIFLMSIMQGNKEPKEWASFCCQILLSQGQKIIKEGKTLETKEENLAELVQLAEAFAQSQLPIIKALGIV